MATTYRARAIHEGTRDGLNAAEWWLQDVIGGRASMRGDPIERRAEFWLTGIVEGDPAVLDYFPFLDLSGQWADGPSERDILDSIVPYDLDSATESQRAYHDDLIELYRDRYDSAMLAAIERACVRELPRSIVRAIREG